MIRIEVNIIEGIEDTLRMETGHITEVDARIAIIKEDIVGIEETVDLGIEVDPLLGIKMKRKCHYCKEPGHFIRECQKRKWDQGQ